VENLRHAVITGAGSGIGKAIAEKLSNSCKVSLIGLSKEKVEAVATRIRCEGGNAFAVSSDLSTREGVQYAIRKIREENGSIDILVNNVGIYPSKPFLEVTDDEWDKIMNVCLKSCFWCCQEVLPDMIKKNRGWVVNISSIDGKTPGPRNSVYSAAKAAMISLTRSLAAEMVDYSINVNSVAPGWVATPTVLQGDRWKDALPKIPLGRLAEPEEIADAVEFLVSQKARYIVGETLNVNGGLLMD